MAKESAKGPKLRLRARGEDELYVRGGIHKTRKTKVRIGKKKAGTEDTFETVRRGEEGKSVGDLEN